MIYNFGIYWWSSPRTFLFGFYFEYYSDDEYEKSKYEPELLIQLAFNFSIFSIINCLRYINAEEYVKVQFFFSFFVPLYNFFH